MLVRRKLFGGTPVPKREDVGLKRDKSINAELLKKRLSSLVLVSGYT